MGSELSVPSALLKYFGEKEVFLSVILDVVLVTSALGIEAVGPVLHAAVMWSPSEPVRAQCDRLWSGDPHTQSQGCPESGGLLGPDGLSCLCSATKLVVVGVGHYLQVQRKALEAPTDVYPLWLIPGPGGLAVWVRGWRNGSRRQSVWSRLLIRRGAL